MKVEHAYKTAPILLVIISKLLGYLEQRFASVFKAKVPAAVWKASLVQTRDAESPSFQGRNPTGVPDLPGGKLFPTCLGESHVPPRWRGKTGWIAALEDGVLTPLI